ncbi:MAG: hypothetical protein ACERKV_13665 [Clostridiaceae bacterium]
MNINVEKHLCSNNKMNMAISRITESINSGKKVVVYGYHDLDSVMGISLLLLLIKYFNGKVEYFIPSNEHANEISKEEINGNCKFIDADLILTVGVGYKPYKCSDIGIDIISTNFNDYEDYNNLKAISCYKLGEAICNYYGTTTVKKYLDLVMIGTIYQNINLTSDIKDLIGQGCRKINNTNNIGIKALLKENNIESISYEKISDVVYSLVKKSKAVSKIDNAKIAVELFTTCDKYRALQIAKYFNKGEKQENVFLKEIIINNLNKL